MFSFDERKLREQPNWYRYLFYLISSCTFISYRSWKQGGEPNPFVSQKPRPRYTHHKEIVDIFGDTLGKEER